MAARWMRFVRVFVAVLAFFVARPAMAAPPVVDVVVLVAEATPAVSAQSVHRATSSEPLASVDESDPVAEPIPVVSAFVVADAYLLNCSLLR